MPNRKTYDQSQHHLTMKPNRILTTLLLLPLAALHSAEEPIAIGSRRELFVDRLLVGELKNTALKLHEPILAEPLKESRPNGHYATVLKAGDKFQFYYRGDKDPKVTWKTHGIEAYVSRKATTLTEPLALTCIRLVAEHLETAWREPGNRPAREGMMLAATLGGMAFANSSVALVHGMSRPIGAVFHVPHGLSNSMLLPAVTRFSLGAAPGRYATIAKAMRLCAPEADEAAAGAALIQGLVDLNTRLEVPRLRDCPGFELKKFESVLEKMAADALASGSPQNNPRVPTADEIVALYREAW